MRITINIDDDLLNEAMRLTKAGGKKDLIHEALKALIQREAASRLAKMGGSELALKKIPRRRSI